MEKVTVIVPVYHVEQYLARCIDSIISQSYKNLELILVDDGSNDNCGGLCDEYRNKDERINVIHKENGGLSSARNAALDMMTGDYVTFIDSDDFITEDYVEKLMGLIKKYHCDIAVCDENRFMEKEGVIEWQGSPYKKIKNDICQTAEEGLETYMKQILYDASACMKLYKSNLFENVRYPEGCNYEDIGTTYKLYCKVEKVAFTPAQMYCYFQRDGSILHSRNYEKLRKNIQDGITMTERQREYVVKRFPGLQDAADCRCFSMYCRAVGLSKSINDQETVDYSWQQIKRLRGKFIKGDYRKKVKIAANLSYLGKVMFVRCYSSAK